MLIGPEISVLPVAANRMYVPTFGGQTFSEKVAVLTRRPNHDSDVVF